MNKRRKAGFTIIEVTLFLGVSGLLIMLLLGGWTVMINTQRYEDSVVSFQGFLQDQYNLVYNVENGRAANLTCDSNTGSIASGTTPRGQTGCVVLGRFLRIVDGSNIQVLPVVGVVLAANDPATSDVEAIRNSLPKVVDRSLQFSDSNFSIPWGAVIVNAAGNSLDYTIAILRSPLADSGGKVHTYIQQVPDASSASNLAGLINTANEDEDVEFCLDAGAPLSGGTRAVVVKAFASSQTYIVSRAQGENSCA